MERPTPELLLRRFASLCPFPGLAAVLQARLVPLLSAASLFVSPRTYSRFVVSLLVFPVPAQALALVVLPLFQAALIVGSLAVMCTAFLVSWMLHRYNQGRSSGGASVGKKQRLLIPSEVTAQKLTEPFETYTNLQAIGATKQYIWKWMHCSVLVGDVQ